MELLDMYVSNNTFHKSTQEWAKNRTALVGKRLRRIQIEKRTRTCNSHFTRTTDCIPRILPSSIVSNNVSVHYFLIFYGFENLRHHITRPTKSQTAKLLILAVIWVIFAHTRTCIFFPIFGMLQDVVFIFLPIHLRWDKRTFRENTQYDVKCISIYISLYLDIRILKYENIRICCDTVKLRRIRYFWGFILFFILFCHIFVCIHKYMWYASWCFTCYTNFTDTK